MLLILLLSYRADLMIQFLTFSPEASEVGWEGGLETSTALLLLFFLLWQHFGVVRPWEVHFGAEDNFFIEVAFES